MPLTQHMSYTTVAFDRFFVEEQSRGETANPALRFPLSCLSRPRQIISHSKPYMSKPRQITEAIEPERSPGLSAVCTARSIFSSLKQRFPSIPQSSAATDKRSLRACHRAAATGEDLPSGP